MKVSLNWLRDLVDVDVSVAELANKFNTHSAEVDEFYQLVEATNLVVGYVTEKVAHPNADKLSVCQVDIGTGVTQIVCGAPNVDKGQKVIVSLPGAVLPGGFKIKKSTIRDVESNGMICSLSELGIDKKYHNEEGIHVLNEDAKVGANPVVEMCLNDEVLSLDLTPNRADLLSMMGVAYDTAAILDKTVHLNEYKVEESNHKNEAKIKIETDNCFSYYARIIEDIEIKPSPVWMQARLIAAGMRPISNVVDITNYVMLETGQPLHAFDFDLVETGKIVVRMAHDKETLETLDGKIRTLSTSDIVITNGERSVALGGVMGGLETEIVSTSKRVLLESAVFSPTHIRKTSSRLDLRSEASMRFERKVDPKRTVYALEMATYLFTKYASGRAQKGIQFVDNITDEVKTINLSLEKINRTLGSDYSLQKVSSVLTRLSFDYTVENDVYVITVPSRRQDIETYQDIIEEIIRIIGYDTLSPTLPTTISLGKLSESQQLKRIVKDTLTSLGLSEAITYSLVSAEKVFDFTKEETKLVRLSMPMSMDKNVLSKTPLNGIVDSVKYNVARKNKDVFFFEIGKRHDEDKETLLLAGALCGEISNTLWQGKKEVVDFYSVKGILSTLFVKLGLSHLEFVSMSDYKNLHPGQSAYITDRTGVVGFIGKLHPEYEKQNDLKDVFVFELDLEKILELRRPLKKAKDINKFPTISRDLALVVDQSVSAKKLEDVIRKTGKRMLENITVFDLYQGENLGENKKSLTIRLEFSDSSRTLEMTEVDTRTKEILVTLEKELQAVLRY